MFQLLWVGQHQKICQKIAQNIQQQSFREVAATETEIGSTPLEATPEVTVDSHILETTSEVEEVPAVSETTMPVDTEGKIEYEAF